MGFRGTDILPKKWFKEAPVMPLRPGPAQGTGTCEVGNQDPERPLVPLGRSSSYTQ